MVPLVVLVGILAVVALAVAPLLLPWQQQIQWLVVSSSAPDPFGLPTAQSQLTLRAVAVESANAQPEGIHVRLGGVAQGEQLVLWGRPADDVVACLRHWATDATPLLLICPAGDETSLHSQTECVTGLRHWPAPPRAADRTAA
jgi:hypothetical protein